MGESVKLRAVLLIAAASLVANIVMWNISVNREGPHTKKEISTRQYTTENTDSPKQQANKSTVAESSSSALCTDCNNAMSTQGNLLLEHVDKKDYRALAADLAKLGLPDSMVKMLVYSYLSGAESAEQDKNDSYWQPISRNPADSTTELLQSNAQKREQLLLIFGEGIKDDPQFYSLFRPFQKTLGYLSSDKQVKLQELQLTAITNAKPQSPTELEHDIESTLGAEDYYEYQLRESPLAKQLQQELSAFKYSEQDYRELYRIKRESRQQLQDAEGSPIQSYQLSGADFGLNGIKQPENSAEEDAIRAYLGEERYREYTLAKQPDFRRMLSVTDANGVDRNNSMIAYEVLDRARTQMVKLHQNTGLNPDQKNYQVNQLLSDTNVELSTVVGESIAEQLVSEVLDGPKLYRN